MKSAIIIAAAGLLTAGIAFAAVALVMNLKDSGGKSTKSDDVSSVAAVSTEATSDELSGTTLDNQEDAASVSSPGKIVIPGFAQLTLKAGVVEQNVKLHNPKENDCYFIISILLSDNTEVYQSSLIAPGSSLTKIKLSKTLKPGIFEDSILRYSCFDFKTLQALNGANTKLTLEVKE